MKEPICSTIAQKIATDAITLADAPEFGHGDTADKPMAAPKVRSTNEMAAARNAPAITAPHSTKLATAAGGVLEPAGAGPTVVMALLSDGSSVQAEKAEDEQDDDHQTDEIDDAVHGVTSVGQSKQGLYGLKRSARKTPWFQSRSGSRSKTAQ
jgi:hypothetical protein